MAMALARVDLDWRFARLRGLRPEGAAEAEVVTTRARLPSCCSTRSKKGPFDLAEPLSRHGGGFRLSSFISLQRILQLLGDDSKLTDGKGHIFNLTHAINMLTNDLGVMNPSRVQATASAGAALPAAARDAALAAVRSHFRPEFLNRLDDIVVFEPLSADTLRRHRTVH